MARRSYGKQFKIAAVKLVLEDNMAVSEVSKGLSIHYNICIDGLMNMKNTGKVRSQAMEPHFIHVNMKLKS